MAILVDTELRDLKEVFCPLQEVVGAYQGLERLGSDWCFGDGHDGDLLLQR